MKIRAPLHLRWTSNRLLILLATLVACSPVVAESVPLVDGNATAYIETQSQFGSSWTVDGDQELYQQGFWYRQASMAAESAVTSLPQASAQKVAPNRVIVTYKAGNFEIDTDYRLEGSAPGRPVSRLLCGLEIRNTSAQPLGFTLFHYADFDLNRSPGGEMAVFTAPSIVQQTEGPTIVAQMVSPTPTHHELSYFPTLRDSLNDGMPTILSDFDGPLGPGDATWAFQWDILIPVDGKFNAFSEQYLALPEPATLGLLATGLLLLRRRARA